MAKNQKAQKKKTVLRPKTAKPAAKAAPKVNAKPKAGVAKVGGLKPAAKPGKVATSKPAVKTKPAAGKSIVVAKTATKGGTHSPLDAKLKGMEAKAKGSTKPVAGKKLATEKPKEAVLKKDEKKPGDPKVLGKNLNKKESLKADGKEKLSKKESSAKVNAKAGGKKAKKKEEGELEDDFLEADDLGSSEIDEYAEELEVVESYSETEEDDDLWEEPEKPLDDEEIALTDAEGRRFCRHKDCDQLSSVEAYCRYHYLLLWKKIQNRKKILLDGKLEKYIEDLTARYPDKFIEVIKRDLRTEKDFLSAIQELELDDSADGDFEEESESFIDEVRGMNESAATGVDDEEF